MGGSLCFFYLMPTLRDAPWGCRWLTVLTSTITATVLAVNGYLLYDLLRQQVWDDVSVDPCWRQPEAVQPLASLHSPAPHPP